MKLLGKVDGREYGSAKVIVEITIDELANVAGYSHYNDDAIRGFLSKAGNELVCTGFYSDAAATLQAYEDLTKDITKMRNAHEKLAAKLIESKQKHFPETKA